MRRALALGALVVAPRLVALWLNENLYGDAVARTWLGHLWLTHPHGIGSFDQGALQFGPLHVYLLGVAEWLWPAPEHAGRGLSLVVGCATAWPLWTLTRDFFDVRAADVAVIVFACWGLQVQCSSTGASEALNLLLVMGAVALLRRWQLTLARAALLGSALCLDLACATRYDSWLLVPLLGAVVLGVGRSVKLTALFTAAASAFAAAWMLGNLADRGDPLYPFRYIDAFHRAWFPSEQQLWGAPTYAAITLLFWPGAAVVTLTPLPALAAGAGMAVALWRRWPSRWLVAVVVVPAALYSVRSTVFHSFAPLARFTIKELAFALPFVWPGAVAVCGAWPRALTRSLVAVAAATLVAWPAWLGWFTFRREGTWENTLRPVSPTSTNALATVRVAERLRREAAPGGGVLIVDVDPAGFEDLQLSFFSGFPYERGARLRSPSFEQRLASGTPSWLVRFEGGELERRHLAELDGATLRYRGWTFEETPLGEGRMHVYRRAP